MSAIPIRSKDGAISLYDILAHICRTDVKTATKRLNNILSGGHTHVPTIRSIIETKTAYTIFPDTINFRPTPVITSTSQGHSVLEEFTSIFNKSARYNKIQALTQQAHLLTFTTDTYPGLCSFLHPSTTTDTPPIALPAPAFLNPSDLPPSLRAPFAQYHDISFSGPTLTAYTTAAVATELPRELLLHTCAVFHRKNKSHKGLTLLYLAAEAGTERFSWAFRSDGQQALTYTYDDSSRTLGCNVFSMTQGVLRDIIQPLVPDILSRTPPPPPFLRIEQPSTDLCLPDSHPSVLEVQELVEHLIKPLPHFASKQFLVIDLDQFTTSLLDFGV
ncbi:hypothetical protein CYMTET_49597 [Cymbomonas tetramitiformis]|uniref:Uncharacterized protein n=1 Tax=Cymbomonas tetramitiformis TaxID=36881 RepID=A0AAE0EVM8_9CHLO|nr:hypothetical protein CYMTET_49597 [Cymbomonas tetramitiformis]